MNCDLRLFNFKVGSQFFFFFFFFSRLFTPFFANLFLFHYESEWTGKMKNSDKFLEKNFLFLMNLQKDRIRGVEYYGPNKRVLTSTNNDSKRE